MKPNVIAVLVLIGVAVTISVRAEEEKKPSPRFTLVCGAQMQKKTFAVDTAARTIDGKRASFGAAAITWKSLDTDPVVAPAPAAKPADTGKKKGAQKKKSVKKPAPRFVLHELNRVEGTYRSWKESDSAETAVVYGCDKAGPVKF